MAHPSLSVKFKGNHVLQQSKARCPFLQTAPGIHNLPVSPGTCWSYTVITGCRCNTTKIYQGEPVVRGWNIITFCTSKVADRRLQQVMFAEEIQMNHQKIGTIFSLQNCKSPRIRWPDQLSHKQITVAFTSPRIKRLSRKIISRLSKKPGLQAFICAFPTPGVPRGISEWLWWAFLP